MTWSHDKKLKDIPPRNHLQYYLDKSSLKLTLIRLTSKKACQDRGEGPTLPLVNLALEHHRAPKTHFSES